MPKNATATKTSRGRAKVKNLPQAARELTAKEAKKVKGGIIIIGGQPADHNYSTARGVIQDITNPGAIGQKVK